MPRKADWLATKTQFIYRHKESGRYYVRAYRQGREVWRALKTTSYEVAKHKAKQELATIHKARNLENAITGTAATFGAVAELYREHIDTATDTKASTKRYHRQTIDALLRSWPGLAEARLSSITEQQCRQWASDYLPAARPKGHGWKGDSEKTISASRFNNTLSTLRSIFELGIHRGIILFNPAASVARVSPKAKPMRIPSREDFRRIIGEIRSAGGAVSQCCADLVEFLAYSGCRIDESRWVKWSDVDRERKQIWIGGHVVTGTKSGKGRWVPITSAMAQLVDDLEANPRYRKSKDRKSNGYVLAVRECQKAINRACTKLNVERFTHHDMRHLFCTACLESGVDFATLARWLGHSDGGSLLAKTYSHLRTEHSQAMAAKVAF
jgi:integrase